MAHLDFFPIDGLRLTCARFRHSPLIKRMHTRQQMRRAAEVAKVTDDGDRIFKQ